jgi:hypothetical protein
MTKKSVWLMAAVAVPVTLAYALDTPPLREGLWSIHTVTTTNPGNKTTDATVTLCRNHAYDAYLDAEVNSHKECTLTKSGSSSRMTIDGSCKVGGSTLVSKATVTMSGDTASHSETHTTYTPALYGTSESTMIQDQKYVGSCPADMQPGDRKSASGTIMHTWKH